MSDRQGPEGLGEHAVNNMCALLLESFALGGQAVTYGPARQGRDRSR
ncbi:MAG: hypothetical protein ACRDRL_22190 [Sciscionella sp.]